MLSFADHRGDPTSWAAALGISTEAVELYLDSDVIDLHVDSFIWNRVFGYDLRRRHGHGLFGGRFYSQVDFPRILEAQLSGATWIITTNPARTARDRAETFVKNLRKLRSIFDSVSDQFQVVRNVAEYREARAAGKHAAFLGIQGGNALDENIEALDRIQDDVILRVTLVHLSSSSLGDTSSPLKIGGDRGLTDFGRDYVKRLNEKKIFVDLAHIGRQGFFDVVAVHDPSQPLLVTHTGIAGVYRHWRNLDDPQLRAIADTGGTVGVMYQASFLGKPGVGDRATAVIDHLEHIVNTIGDDHASLGSDWDGAIAPPRDIPTCLELPRLVQLMLDRGWDDIRIKKILGGSFLRTVEALRG
ncbi:MAG: hypothetical protein DRI90_17785 [Deltaproteobacteria bacterium]|nr:MAG: hypothetical protein DRI90_17785 [Deltaproteobacteria bacterium]